MGALTSREGTTSIRKKITGSAQNAFGLVTILTSASIERLREFLLSVWECSLDLVREVKGKRIPIQKCAREQFYRITPILLSEGCVRRVYSVMSFPWLVCQPFQGVTTHYSYLYP